MGNTSRSRVVFLALAVAALVAGAGVVPAPARAERLFLPLDREGPWIAPDKGLHFGCSFMIATAWRMEGRSEGQAATYTFSIGVAKELYDATLKRSGTERGISRKDLVADLLGTAAGILFFRAVDP
jgi:uncharacterized protein YfiM (DUF2279 family)